MSSIRDLPLEITEPGLYAYDSMSGNHYPMTRSNGAVGIMDGLTNCSLGDFTFLRKELTNDKGSRMNALVRSMNPDEQDLIENVINRLPELLDGNSNLPPQLLGALKSIEIALGNPESNFDEAVSCFKAGLTTVAGFLL